METVTLQQLIESGRREYYPNAKPWPNGLGFDYRGWSWSYDERIHKWQVSKERNGRRVYGRGENPFDAYAHAVPVKES